MSLKKLIDSLQKEKDEIELKVNNLTDQPIDSIPDLIIKRKENENKISELVSNILDKIESPDILSKISESLNISVNDNNLIRSNILISFRQNPKAVFDLVDGYLDNQDKEKIENDFKSYDPLSKTNRKYIYKDDNKLDELKRIDKDNKYIKDLDYLKENIFKQRNANDHDIDVHLSEDTIRYKKLAVNRKNAVVSSKDEYFSKYMEYNEAVTFTYKDGINKIDDVNELDTKLKEREINISKDKKDILINSLNLLDKMKDYKTGDPLLNLDDYRTEEGVKIYAFKNFASLFEDSTSAIENNDLSKLSEISKIHKKETKEMDNLITELSKLENKSFPSNISCARTESLPLKYEENYIETSNVNGLWHTLAFIKYSKVDIKEFVNKPVETYIKFLENNKGVPEIEDLGKNGDIDFIKNISNNKNRSIISRTLNNKYNNFRALEFVSSVDNKNYEKNFLTYQYLKQIKINTPFTEKMKTSNEIFSSINPETIKNVLLNQDKENKYVDLFNKDFDSKKYIKESNIDTKKFLDKIESFEKAINDKQFNGKENDIKKGIALASKELVTSKNLTSSKEFNKLCEIGGIPPYKAIRELAGSRDIANYVKDNYQNKTKDGINKDNVIDAANSLKLLSDQYNKRTIFGKYLRSEGRAEKRLIDQIKADCTKAGITDDQIKDFEKGNISDNLFKEKKTDTKIKLDIKSLDEDLIASKDEIKSKDMVRSLDKDLTNDLEV